MFIAITLTVILAMLVAVWYELTHTPNDHNL